MLAQEEELLFVPWRGADPNGVTILIEHVHEEWDDVDGWELSVTLLHERNGEGIDTRSDARDVAERWFLCPFCGAWCDWEFGCADDQPVACDACWANAKAVEGIEDWR